MKANIELTELKKLAEQITLMSDARNYRARRICRSINKVPDKELDELKRDYASKVTEWNDSWNTFTVKLTMYADFSGFVKNLDFLQSRFVDAGGLLLYCLNNRDSHDFRFAKEQLEDCLNSISGLTFVLSRDLLKLILIKEGAAYSDPKEFFTREDYDSASTWKLVKFLFKSPHAH